MKFLLILLLAAVGFAQTATAKTKVPVQSTVKTQLVAEKKRADDATRSLAEALSAWRQTLDAKIKLIDENVALEKKNEELDKKSSEIRASALEVVNFTTKLNEEYTKLLTDHTALVDRYNSVLEAGNRQAQLANERLARQQRFNNALALYSLMPKYQAPPLQIYAPPPALVMNCTSNTLGQTVYTNCH